MALVERSNLHEKTYKVDLGGGGFISLPYIPGRPPSKGQPIVFS